MSKTKKKGAGKKDKTPFKVVGKGGAGKSKLKAKPVTTNLKQLKHKVKEDTDRVNRMTSELHRSIAEQKTQTTTKPAPPPPQSHKPQRLTNKEVDDVLQQISVMT